MDFKVDENLPAEIAQLLNAAGHSAATVLAEGLGGASDEAVLAAARSERRILVTLDTGFADIHQRSRQACLFSACVARTRPTSLTSSRGSCRAWLFRA